MSNELEELNVNLGKVTENDFKESNSMTIIRSIMEKNNKIKVRGQEADKIPNLDGKLMILDNSSKERITVEIQVKTLPEAYNETNPYYYDCDTKVFNVVLYRVTFNPVVLLLVDKGNNKIFWKYISYEYAKSLNIGKQETKRIKFTENDLYVEDTFLDALVLEAKRLKLLLNEGDNAFITTNLDEDNPHYIEMQEEVDRINNIMDNDLNFIKKILFSNVWKFGIAYTENDGNSQFGIYTIKKGLNKTLIKNFDVNEKYMQIQFNFSGYKNSIKDCTNTFLVNILDTFYKNDTLFCRYLPENVLNEIVYVFLDNLSYWAKDYRSKKNNGYYFKDEENIDNVFSYLNGLVLFYYELFYGKMTNRQSDFKDANINIFKNRGAFLVLNPLMQPDIEEYELLLECLNSSKKPPRTMIICSSSISLTLVRNVLTELKKRNIETVKREWKKSYFDGNDTNEVFYKNIDKLYENLINTYKDTYYNIFGENNDFKLHGEYMIAYDVKNQFDYLYTYKNSQELNIVKFNQDFTNILSTFYENTEYAVKGRGFSLNMINFNKTPMLSYIKAMIIIGIINKLKVSNEAYKKFFGQESFRYPLLKEMLNKRT